MAEHRGDMRAADADREFVAEQLRGALNEGRLTLTEYDERLRDAYAAKTYGELDPVLADLPGVRSAQRSQVVPSGAAGGASGAPAPGRPTMPVWLARIWGAYAFAVTINVVIWLIVSATAGQWIYFWPIWVAGPWGVVLLMRTARVGRIGVPPDQGSDQRRVDRDARRAARRAARRDAR